MIDDYNYGNDCDSYSNFDSDQGCDNYFDDVYDDWCYECSDYGNDYYINEDGEWEYACQYCFIHRLAHPEYFEDW